MATDAAASEQALPAVVDEARRTLRAPWAASIAGLLFAVLFTAAMYLLRTTPFSTADDAQVARLFAEGQDQAIFIGGLYLAPFAGILFLWFIAVIRDQVGEREDRFFSTVFFGSGVLFVAVLFASAAVASAQVSGVRYLDQPPPPASSFAFSRALAYTLLFGFGTRAASVFLMSFATLGLRSRTFPRWIALIGYLLALLMLIVVAFFEWIILVLPAWVAIVSIFVLRRERSRRRHA